MGMRRMASEAVRHWTVSHRACTRHPHASSCPSIRTLTNTPSHRCLIRGGFAQRHSPASTAGRELHLPVDELDIPVFKVLSSIGNAVIHACKLHPRHAIRCGQSQVLRTLHSENIMAGQTGQGPSTQPDAPQQCKTTTL